ncbi:MAG: PaaI family thioesterase [Chlorobi bacterium]|nr:PaaI family thioesterase [Chlorobiota bacterium]
MKVPIELPFSGLDKTGLPLPAFFSAWLTRQSREGIIIDPFFIEKEQVVVWNFSGGKETTGPPGYCHGGFLATLLDECMGSCGIWQGIYLMAVNLEVSYKKAVETGKTMFCASRITKIVSRKVITEGWISDDSQTVYAYARGTYLSVDTVILKEQPPGLLAFEKYRKLLAQGYPIREILEKLKSE